MPHNCVMCGTREGSFFVNVTDARPVEEGHVGARIAERALCLKCLLALLEKEKKKE